MATSEDVVEAHAAALIVALIQAGETARARAFQRWWVTRASSSEQGMSRQILVDEWQPQGENDWTIGPDEYDADELGIDPEEDYDDGA